MQEVPDASINFKRIRFNTLTLLQLGSYTPFSMYSQSVYQIGILGYTHEARIAKTAI